ncbi:Lysophospholipase [[Candida] zeylanoides]
MLEHKKLTKINLYALLNRNRIPSFDHYSFLADETRSVSIGFAISGGGYRSMLTGAGVIAAFDARTTNSTSANGLGGLLQSGNYIAGISGGAWLVMNLLASDFQPVVESIQDQSCSWDLGDSLLEGVPNFDPEMLETQVAQLTQDQFQPVESKKPPIVNTENPSKLVKLGLVQNLLKIFNFSYRSSNVVTTKESTNKEDGMFSKILKPILFKKHASADRREDFAGSIKRVIYYYRDIHLEIRSKKMAGFPITLTDYWEAVPEKQFTSETSHTLEITPFEFGSWEPHLNSFVNVTYLGTRLQDGRPQGDNCVTGYDNLGFLTGVSSSVFNYIFVYLFQNLLETQSSTSVAIQNILKSFGLKSNSKSWYGPQQHPDFAMYSRKVDVVFAFDMSGDLENLPNGTNKGPVDNTDEVYLGESNPFCYVPPLIIYTANTNHSFPSNRSTFQLSYSASEVRGMIQNGYNLATFMNGTVESDYAVNG